MKQQQVALSLIEAEDSVTEWEARGHQQQQPEESSVPTSTATCLSG